MEISKVSLKLPVRIKGSDRFNIAIDQSVCGSDCLHLSHKRYQYALPQGDQGRYVFVTDNNTVIKSKKYTETGTWKEFGFQYNIEADQQTILYDRLIKQEIDGLVGVKKQCKCAMETNFIHGELAWTSTNPSQITHELYYGGKRDWKPQEFWVFVESSIDALKTIHSNEIVHGDPCAHNIMINGSEVTYIDLDTLMPATPERMERDYLIYFFFGVIPIGRQVLPKQEFNQLVYSILQSTVARKLTSLSVSKLRNGSSTDNHGLRFIAWHQIFMTDNVASLSQRVWEQNKQIGELRIASMEINRIMGARLDISEKDRKSRLEVIEKLEALLKESEKDRADRLGGINQLNELLQQSEKDRAQRLLDNQKLHDLLQATIHERDVLLQEIEQLKSENTNHINLINELKQQLIKKSKWFRR
ncbi:hypothetical protein [Cohnella hongkongensis]|uniref:Protein kinase domain-containing protein n=1 Tax=Cohnella hongkongensis TaxID=178337 RepID=A0ABV9FFA0_9BACL